MDNLSGIYKFTFSNNAFYIGKSTNVEKRWKQHLKSMEQGKHTKNIQQAYDEYGEPDFNVIYWCHPDHIDILENYFIGLNWSNSLILNSTAPIWYNDEELDFLLEADEQGLWSVSSFEHVATMLDLTKRAAQLQHKLSKYKKAEEMDYEIEKLTAEVSRLKNRGFLARLLNT